MPTFFPPPPRTPEYDEGEPIDEEDPESLEGWIVYSDIYEDIYEKS